MALSQEALIQRNIGETLDQLANLDPKGIGINRILYTAARDCMGEPLSMKAAKALTHTVKEGDLVYILTGFVVMPYGEGEMDGISGALFLARALARAFGAKPVLICQEENLKAVRELAFVAGLHLYDNVDDLKRYPMSVAAIGFTKDSDQAQVFAEHLVKKGMPSAVIATECASPHKNGVYHAGSGANITKMQAKMEVLFELLRQNGVLSIGIGDWGNELGMGAIAAQVERYVPHGAPHSCACGCGGGISSRVEADYIITSAISNWGTYTLVGALAFLRRDIELIHTAEMEQAALEAACRSGMVDGYNWRVPMVDLTSVQMNTAWILLLREIVLSAIRLESAPVYKVFFEEEFREVLRLGYFDQDNRTEQEEGKMSKQIISCDKAPKAGGPYSQAVVCNGFVFVSGTMPVVPDTGEIAGGGITGQAKQALDNLSAVLQAANSSLDNVVKTTVFLKDMNDFSTVNEIYASYFKGDCPARSCVEVARLPRDILFEIECIAYCR